MHTCPARIQPAHLHERDLPGLGRVRYVKKGESGFVSLFPTFIRFHVDDQGITAEARLVRVSARPCLDPGNDPRIGRIGNVEATCDKRLLHVADDSKLSLNVHHTAAFDIQMTNPGDSFNCYSFHSTSQNVLRRRDEKSNCKEPRRGFATKIHHCLIPFLESATIACVRETIIL